MKIGMVGCGALGSFYGAKLCRAGQETHFLLRSDYEIVRQRGVKIFSAEGDFLVTPHCARTPEEIGICDLVVIGLKTTANDQFGKLLPPLVGPNTAILTLQNGLGNEELLAGLFGSEKILGGLCFVCLNRIAPGEIQHVAHARIVLGEFGRHAMKRTHQIAELFRQAGVPCDVSENLHLAHWEKLVWNIPFNGLGVAGSVGYDPVIRGEVISVPTPGPCLTTDLLLADPKWEKLVRELMRETIAAARGLGLPLESDAEEKQISRTLDMGAYRASTLIDFERGLPLELEALFFEPWRRAREKGVSTPRLAAMCEVLGKLDRLHTRG